MFRLRFSDGGELVLTEAGKKKRAGVWLVTPEQLDADLAHLGPDALEVDSAVLADIFGRERRQLHPLLRDQRLIAGSAGPTRTRSFFAHGCRRSRALTELAPEEVEGLAAAMRQDLERALELREHGKGDKDVYAIHNRLGSPAPVRYADRKSRFEEHTIYYCPSCQTGGGFRRPPALAPSALRTPF